MIKNIQHLEVHIWGQLVGALALDPILGYYAFAYDKRFGKTGIELSPLHMPLNTSEEPYIFTELPELTYKRLPAMIADVLPDDFGNAIIDYYMASQGISKSQVSILDRLAYMGKHAMGALEFKPAHGPQMHQTFALEMRELVNEARQVLRGDFSDKLDLKTALRNIIAVGTSAGGARAKAVIGWDPLTNEVCNGQIELPPRFQHWLLKFDGMGKDSELGVTQDYGRIEYAYSLMAKAAGIQMSATRLFEEQGRAHFMTQRFDRAAGNIKYHMQSLCAMNHLDYKKKSTNSYEQLFTTISELKLEYKDLTEAYKRMVFNIVGRNCDDHTKNFAFIMRQGQGWELAPAYDITFAYNPHGEWTHQHLMSVNGKFKDIIYADLMAVANRYGIGQAEEIINNTHKVFAEWRFYAEQAGLNKNIIAEVGQQHLTLI
jgi:serine/threonine-protein kinase HipA